MRRVLIALLVLLAIGCKGGSVAGRYSIQQDNNGLGEGAEKGSLDLRDDGSYDITIGSLTLAKGTWKADGGHVTLSEGAANMGTSYRIDGRRLIPEVDGKEVTFWRFVKK